MSEIEQKLGSVDRERTERSELDAMVQRLGRSPRLAHLLSFVGNHYFRGETDQLREHNIAIRVFGRPQDFDPAQDAIARVEAHRLRKKLKEYYALDGRDSEVQISLPAGNYVPQFTHRSAVPAASRPEPAVEIGQTIPQSDARFAPSKALAEKARRPGWLWPAVAISLTALVSLVGFVFLRPGSTKTANTRPQAATVASPLISYPISGGASPRVVRLLAGHSGQPHPDPSGNLWQADRYFQGGGSWRGAPGFTARTNDPLLFQSIRSGDLSYAIPLPAGVYELHLYFAEPSFGPGLGGGEGSRLFHVRVNGQTVLPNFDIESDAMGLNVADERVFKDLSPLADGKLHVELESVSGKPFLNGLTVLPARPHQLNPVRITTQPNVYIDHAGKVWNPDNYYFGGQYVRRLPADGTADPDLIGGERWGHFDYAIPVDTNGTYTLTLYFAERYFGPQSPGAGGVGSRVMNVMCNGVMLLHNFDIFQEVGAFRALSKTFRHLRPSPQGKLNIIFEPVRNYAVVSAIEVEDESQ